MRSDPALLAGPRPGLVWPVRADPAGVHGPTRNEARGPHWRTTSRGLFVPATVDGSDVDQRIVEAAAVLPHHGFVTGWASLRWQGGYWFGGLDGGLGERPVWINAHIDDIREQYGFRVTSEELRPPWITQVDGMRVVTPACAVLAEMRYAPNLRAAVRVLDMAAYSDLVSIDEAAHITARQNRFTGIQQARDALKLADENAWSPPEVDMRMAWTLDAGLPRPLCNRPLFDLGGRLIGTPDLIDPEAGVVGEYDGALHLAGSQRARDVEREAYARARFQDEERRSWTVRQPAWWIASATVEQRRALTEAQRVRLLGHRLRVA